MSEDTCSCNNALLAEIKGSVDELREIMTGNGGVGYCERVRLIEHERELEKEVIKATAEAEQKKRKVWRTTVIATLGLLGFDHIMEIIRAVMSALAASGT